MHQMPDIAVIACANAQELIRSFQNAPDYEDPSREQVDDLDSRLSIAYRSVPTTLDGVLALADLVKWEMGQLGVSAVLHTALGSLRAGMENVCERARLAEAGDRFLDRSRV